MFILFGQNREGNDYVNRWTSRMRTTTFPLISNELNVSIKLMISFQF